MAGRKQGYHELVEPYLDKITYWRKDGYTEKQIAESLGIGYSTLSKYKTEHMELVEALKRGKEDLIIDIENSLYKRAKGYEYEEVKEVTEVDAEGREKTRTEKVVKHLPPDTTALIFSLKNLRPEKWRDKQEINHSGAISNEVNILIDGVEYGD